MRGTQSRQEMLALKGTRCARKWVLFCGILQFHTTPSPPAGDLVDSSRSCGHKILQKLSAARVKGVCLQSSTWKIANSTRPLLVCTQCSKSRRSILILCTRVAHPSIWNRAGHVRQAQGGTATGVLLCAMVLDIALRGFCCGVMLQCMFSGTMEEKTQRIRSHLLMFSHAVGNRAAFLSWCLLTGRSWAGIEDSRWECVC